ncbi:unnamed protein product [marine sediment metagenome]|uniref:Uncharacterized protein n=1 Tax=marine sediment metagenome TaxID=412755 RepID=X1RV06_9ZZZZ
MSKESIDKALEMWKEKVKEGVNLPDTISAVLDQAIGMISAGDEEAGKFQEQIEALILNLPDEDKKRINRFLLDFNYIQGICRLDEKEDCKLGTDILTERVKEFKGEVESSPSLVTLLSQRSRHPVSHAGQPEIN